MFNSEKKILSASSTCVSYRDSKVVVEAALGQTALRVFLNHVIPVI